MVVPEFVTEDLQILEVKYLQNLTVFPICLIFLYKNIFLYSPAQL